MNLILCSKSDSDIAMPLGEVAEDTAQQIVVSTLNFFKSFLDTRPWADVGELSGRATNVLRRNKATTIADVRRLLTQAQSNQGVFGAGRLVMDEWKRLLA